VCRLLLSPGRFCLGLDSSMTALSAAAAVAGCSLVYYRLGDQQYISDVGIGAGPDGPDHLANGMMQHCSWMSSGCRARRLSFCLCWCVLASGTEVDASACCCLAMSLVVIANMHCLFVDQCMIGMLV